MSSEGEQTVREIEQHFGWKPSTGLKQKDPTRDLLPEQAPEIVQRQFAKKIVNSLQGYYYVAGSRTVRELPPEIVVNGFNAHKKGMQERLRNEGYPGELPELQLSHVYGEVLANIAGLLERRRYHEDIDNVELAIYQDMKQTIGRILSQEQHDCLPDEMSTSHEKVEPKKALDPTRDVLPEIEPQTLLRQLKQSCDTFTWANRWMRPERQPALAVRRPLDEGTSYVFEMEAEFLKGVQRIIFSRYLDLRDAGYEAEALQILDSWGLGQEPRR